MIVIIGIANSYCTATMHQALDIVWYRLVHRVLKQFYHGNTF